MLSKITPCLWFDTQGEEAANFYISIFKNSKITAISYYPDTEEEPGGDVLTVAFELEGQPFTALNAGPRFTFNEAISLQIECLTQDEVDSYTEKLGAGGPPEAQQCGWVKDRFGVSWQIVPKIMLEFLKSPDAAAAKRAFEAMLQMKKLDIAALQRAFEG